MTCVATPIGAGWAVTAAHCLVLGGAVLLRHPRGAPAYPVVEVRRHPDLDIALVHVPELRLPRLKISDHPGDRLHMLLLARAELNESKSRVVDAHWNATPASLTSRARNVARVRTLGRPCQGDSGTPLLSHSGNGHLVGILTRGSTSCTGDDEVVLLGPIAHWIGITLH